MADEHQHEWQWLHVYPQGWRASVVGVDKAAIDNRYLAAEYYPAALRGCTCGELELVGADHGSTATQVKQREDAAAERAARIAKSNATRAAKRAGAPRE